MRQTTVMPLCRLSRKAFSSHTLMVRPQGGLRKMVLTLGALTMRPLASFTRPGCAHEDARESISTSMKCGHRLFDTLAAASRSKENSSSNASNRSSGVAHSMDLELNSWSLFQAVIHIPLSRADTHRGGMGGADGCPPDAPEGSSSLRSKNYQTAKKLATLVDTVSLVGVLSSSIGGQRWTEDT